eukprot:m.416833 g.416833  ORF g.416833 m.416833 type:complete len:360 (+) comp21283_c0_seq13:158-1237(+)
MAGIPELAQGLGPSPPSMKPIAVYLKLGLMFDKSKIPAARCVGYYCRMHAAELAVSKYKSNEAVPYLMKLLDLVEESKKILSDDPYLKDEMAAYKAVEEQAYKFFNAADKEDRAGKATSKTAQMYLHGSKLFDVLKTLSPECETDETVQKLKKYAQFKSYYIMKCLKQGITPVAGPVDADGNPMPDDTSDSGMASTGGGGGGGVPSFDSVATYDADNGASFGSSTTIPPQQPYDPYNDPALGQTSGYPSTAADSGTAGFAAPGGFGGGGGSASPGWSHDQAPQFPIAQQQTPAPAPRTTSAGGGGGGASLGNLRPRPSLSITEQDQAELHCKYAISALQYADVPTALKEILAALKLVSQ